MFRDDLRHQPRLLQFPEQEDPQHLLGACGAPHCRERREGGDHRRRDAEGIGQRRRRRRILNGHDFDGRLGRRRRRVIRGQDLVTGQLHQPYVGFELSGPRLLRCPLQLLGLERGAQIDEFSPGRFEFGCARLRFGPEGLDLGLDALRCAFEALTEFVMLPPQRPQRLQRGWTRRSGLGDVLLHGFGSFFGLARTWKRWLEDGNERGKVLSKNFGSLPGPRRHGQLVFGSAAQRRTGCGRRLCDLDRLVLAPAPPR